MLPDRVSNPGPLTSESGALPIALCGPGPDQTTPSEASGSALFAQPYLSQHTYNLKYFQNVQLIFKTLGYTHLSLVSKVHSNSYIFLLI